MLRYLQKSKAKKGFTIIELIVVIAIIAVLSMIILPLLSNENSRIQEARTAATDFYAAVQTAMNKFSHYDGSLTTSYSVKNESIVRYYAKMGGNYPYDEQYDKDASITDHDYPLATSLYIMVYAKNDKIETIGMVSRAKSSSSEAGFFRLLQRNAADRSTEFGRLFAAEIDDRVSFRDGYYYARVDFNPPTNPDKSINKDEINSETVRVAYAAYCRRELPKSTLGGNVSEFENANLYFGSDFRLNCDEICGTCAPMQSSGDYVGLRGTKLD